MKSIALLFFLLSLSTSFAFEYKPNESLALDPNIKYGNLNNGFQYYIEKNNTPEEFGYLYLIIDVGSLQEENDQLGIAHFIEHMAFNGSKNFQPGEIIEFMQSIGMEFGPEINATTSYEETIYKLKIPTHDPEIIKKSFQILSDWAFEISFEEKSLENEKLVIREEWRSRLGLQERIKNEIQLIIFDDSKYKNRHPIGDMEQIANFSSEDLKKFYQKWYRPNLMKLFAVGDFEVEEIENLVYQYFDIHENPTNYSEKKEYFIPNHLESVNIVSDPEQPTSEFYLMMPIEKDEYKKQVDYFNYYKNSIGYSLFYFLMNDISQNEGSPFQSAMIFESPLGKNNNYLNLQIQPVDGQYLKAIEEVKKEYYQILSHGFSEIKFNNMINTYKENLKNYYNNKETINSFDKLNYLIEDINSNSVHMSDKYFYEMSMSILDQLEVKDINDSVLRWLDSTHRTIIIIEPQETVSKLPSADKFITALNKEFGSIVEVIEIDWAQVPLIKDNIKSGEIVNVIEHKSLDIIEWHMSNGVKVILKQTDFEEDNIVLHGMGLGGTSLSTEKDFQSVKQINELFKNAGVGEFSSNNLQKKLLSFPAIEVSPFIDEYKQGINGETNLENFESMLQLIYLYFTDPYYEKRQLDLYKRDLEDEVKNRLLNPNTVFLDYVTKVIYNNHPRKQPLTPEILNSLDYNVMYNFYKERFADASGFTFYIVGNIALEENKETISKYLGSLPSLNHDNHWKNIHLKQSQGEIHEVVKNNPEPQAFTILRYSNFLDPNFIEYNLNNRLSYYILSSAINIHLNSVIREKLGGVYSIGSVPVIEKYPIPEYNFSIYFLSAPHRQEELTLAIKKEIKNFQIGNFDEKIVDNALEQAIQDYEEDIKTNDYWIKTLSFYDWINEPHKNVLLIDDLHKKSTKQDIVEIANKIFNTPNIMEFVQLPKD